jgi:hypothetical protein
MTSRDIYQARMNIEDLFMSFDEYHGVESFKLDHVLDVITTEEAQLTEELKQYFQTMQSNENYLQDLARQLENVTAEHVQFIVDYFTILDDLVKTGMRGKGIYQAHDSIYDLLKEFEEQVEAEENRLRAEDIESISLPSYLQNTIDTLTIFPNVPKREVITYATV